MIPNKIYISGPITDPQTGRPIEGWRERFNGMAEHLRQQGLGVINPVNIADAFDLHVQRQNERGDTFTQQPDREDYLLVDIQTLYHEHANGTLAGILMLEGWEQSDGARAEYHFARVLGVPVFSQPDHGYQLNSHGVAMGGDNNLRDLLEWYTLAELARALRNDPEDIKTYPDLATLREYLERKARGVD